MKAIKGAGARPGANSGVLLMLLRHEALKSIFVVGVPSRQRWAVFDEIFCGPLNTLLIHLPRDRIVRAENVEITVPHGSRS